MRLVPPHSKPSTQKPLYSLQSPFRTCNRRFVRPCVELEDAVSFCHVRFESHRCSIYYVLALLIIILDRNNSRLRPTVASVREY
jgi:hypothetical protein